MRAWNGIADRSLRWFAALLVVCGSLLAGPAVADKLLYQSYVPWGYSPMFSTPEEAAAWYVTHASANGFTSECYRIWGPPHEIRFYVSWPDGTGVHCGAPARAHCQRADGTFYPPFTVNNSYWRCDCPAGQTWSPLANSCVAGAENLGNQECPVMTQHPIHVGLGNKFRKEVDYSGSSGLSVVRYYNSLSGRLSDYHLGDVVGHWGANWQSTFDRRIIVNNYWMTSISALREDGQVVSFSGPKMGPFSVVGNNKLTLTRVSESWPTQWILKTENDAVELYQTDGRLLSVTSRTGEVQTLTYSDGSSGANGGHVLDAAGQPTSTVLPAGLLIRVQHSHGHTLAFGYNSANKVVKFTNPAGAEFIYSYDAAGNLTSVKYPATTDSPLGASRTYIYSEPANAPFTSAAYPFANVLTGIRDEAGARYATFKYNAAGRAISSALAGNADATEVSYTVDADNNVTSAVVTDALGTARTYQMTTVSGVIRRSSISQPCAGGCGSTQSTQYDSNGNVSSATDFKGGTTTYSYNLTRNLETSRSEAHGTALARTTATQWHSTFRLPSQIDEPGRRTTYTHDANGNVLTRTVTDLTTSPNTSRTWTFTYNSFGKVLTADGPRTDASDVTTYTYYTCTTGYECGQVNTITNALGHVTTFNSYNAHGMPLTITDPNGVSTTLTYDARQRLTSRTVGSEQTTFEYWPTGLLKKTTLPDGAFLLYTYDAAHRLTDIEDAEGNKIHYTLDAAGNRTAEEVRDSSNALARTSTQVFNTLNQLWKQIGAAGGANVTTTFGYDANGNQTSIAAPLARNTAQTYDELNRLSTVTDPESGLTQYTYDALDQLIAVTDPKGLTTSYTINGLGDLKQQVSPDTGTTTNTFDSGGNLSTSTDARNVTVTHSYDALNRVTSSAFGDQTISFGYDAGTNGKGRLTSASDADHSLAWTYDAHGRVTSKQQIVGGVSRTVSYGYTDGNLTSVTTPSGQSIVYGYTNGKVTSISVNGTALLNGVLYDPFGPIRQWTWGNSTLSVRTFDQDGRTTQIDSAGLRTYSYDDASRITDITDATDSALSWSYGYDDLDRLTSASKTGTMQGFSYDANGNRLAQTGTSASTFTAASNSNRLTNTSGALARTYSYDSAGNTTGYGGLTFSYNNRGRMASSTTGGVTTSYVYNAIGQRVRKTTNGSSTYFTYDEAGHLLGEYGAAGAFVEETVWFGNIPVAVLKPNGSGGVNLFHVHSDHLNTPRKITRSNDNAVVWRWDSDAFGTDLPNENPTGIGFFSFHLRFPGQYFDSESGLHYNYFRDYDASTGRYVQSDPTGLEGGLNTYAYGMNNPVSFVDPTGELSGMPPLWANPASAAVNGSAILGWGIGTAIYAAFGDSIQSGLEKAFPYSRSWRERRGRWKVYVRCNVTAFGASCDCPPPETIGGWAYGKTFGEAFANAQHDANANLGDLGKRNCYPRHCQPVACFENGRAVPCPKSGR